MLCGRRACADREIHTGSARVEVSIPRAGFAELAAGAHTQVAWAHGETTVAFHAECWETLRDLAASGDMVAAELALMRVSEATAERFDSSNTLEAKAKRAAGLLSAASSVICFTGAGISTAAGLRDYRGKRGKWTLEAQGEQIAYTTEYEALRPTFTHEAIAKLVEMGRLVYVVSQNADGLHHLSGIPYSKLSDVHGSAFTERCSKCAARYVRQCYVPDDTAEEYLAKTGKRKSAGSVPAHIKRCRGCKSNHWTGRQCDKCGGALRDTVVSFGDGLESSVLGPALEAAARADACLSLGSSMSIGPSNQVVLMQRGPLVACVRQDTEMDTHCASTGGVRAYGDCDDFMRALMGAMLGEEAFAEWVASLAAKAPLYDAQRPPPGCCKKRGDIFVKK